MINETNDKIRYTSLKFFLEKGYEATNIRDICKAVGIKPSSLYFYYKSKQELFLSIYDEIWEKKIKFLENIDVTNTNSSSELKFKQFFKLLINYHSDNILNEKFLLRYHLFPAEELNDIIKDKYNFWSKKENKVLLDLVYKYKDNDVFKDETVMNDFLFSFKSFMNHQIISMITNNIKPNSLEQDIYWIRFYNSFVLNLRK